MAEIRLQSWQLGLSLAKNPRLVPVPLCLSEFLSKIGTHLLASPDIMEKNRSPPTCLRNAGSYFVECYCNGDPGSGDVASPYVGGTNPGQILRSRRVSH